MTRITSAFARVPAGWQRGAGRGAILGNRPARSRRWTLHHRHRHFVDENNPGHSKGHRRLPTVRAQFGYKPTGEAPRWGFCECHVSCTGWVKRPACLICPHDRPARAGSSAPAYGRRTGSGWCKAVGAKHPTSNGSLSIGRTRRRGARSRANHAWRAGTVWTFLQRERIGSP